MKPLIGRWDVDPSRLKFLSTDTAVLPNEQHEGPVFKFPQDVPPAGAGVAVFHGFDVCKARGEDKHRPRVKIALRVYPANHKAHGSLRLGTESEAAPYRRFWIDEGLFLYVDDGNPHSACPTCGKRSPIAEAETHCQFIPPSYNETPADWMEA